MRIDELDATIQMMLYTDRSYTKAYSSAPTIELRDKVGQRFAQFNQSHCGSAICISDGFERTFKKTKCFQVYVEVAVTQPADFFLLRVNECWATQSPQANTTEGLVHTLILNG